MVVSRSIVVIAIQVSRKNCVMGNHNVNILKLIARVKELEFSVEKGGMDVCPKGVVERVGKILFGNVGSGFHYVEESLLQMFWQGLKETNVYVISEISFHFRNVGCTAMLVPGYNQR